ncbi:tubby-related protein 3-like [Sorex fumeus]|uniref:tubby-related protein 3-like n=1 Tax=Sorex fumeus TaxID=62283 RepID=UPI0024ACC619|nr:tubby-related protein 3-like [Sorex fumeus]
MSGVSDSLDVYLKERQHKLDHQRDLLEKRQRRKRLDPMVVRPNPVTGLPLAKPRSGESRFYLRSSCPPGNNFILPGAVDPVATTRPSNQDSVPELLTIPLNSSSSKEETEGQAAGTSTAVAASQIDAVDADLELPEESQDSFVTIEDIDECNEECRLTKLASKKFFNIHDVIGADNKDLDLKLPVSSQGSPTSIEKIEATGKKPRSPKLASKKFYDKDDILAHMILEREEKAKKSQESAEAILKHHLPLFPVGTTEDEDSFQSAMVRRSEMFLVNAPNAHGWCFPQDTIESFETAVPEMTEFMTSLSNLKDFAYHQAPQDTAVRCMIIKDIKGIFPGYYMFVEVKENKELFVLAARKYKKFMRSEYIISTDFMDLCRGGTNYIGRLRANLMKTKYTLYSRMDPNQCRDLTEKCSTQQKLGTITYKNKALRFQRPKSITVIIPISTESEEQVPVESKRTLKDFFSKWRKKTKDNVVEFKNKYPIGNLKTQSYCLPQWMKDKSQKTFQLIQGSETSRVVMQLEHVIKQQFFMEYSHPLSTVQAFAIALSRLDRG